MDNILECENLTKCYGKAKALDHVTLGIPKGRIVGLLGPNGSGKTTFIKICNSLLTPTSGKIRIGGFEPGVETKKIVSYLPERNYPGAARQIIKAKGVMHTGKYYTNRRFLHRGIMF